MNTLHRPNRNEPQPVCSLLVGQTGVYTAPKALAADTVGVGAGVGVGVASMMTDTSCMPTIFHLPSLFISVMS